MSKIPKIRLLISIFAQERVSWSSCSASILFYKDYMLPYLKNQIIQELFQRGLGRAKSAEIIFIYIKIPLLRYQIQFSTHRSFLKPAEV